MSTKKYSHGLKVELFIGWEYLGLSISVALGKLLQGGTRGSQVTYKFAAEGADSLNIKDQVSS